MHVRYVCGDCGIKWFSRDGDGPGSSPTACAACGGALRPLEPERPMPALPDDEPSCEPAD